MKAFEKLVRFTSDQADAAVDRLEGRLSIQCEQGQSTIRPISLDTQLAGLITAKMSDDDEDNGGLLLNVIQFLLKQLEALKATFRECAETLGVPCKRGDDRLVVDPNVLLWSASEGFPRHGGLLDATWADRALLLLKAACTDSTGRRSAVSDADTEMLWEFLNFSFVTVGIGLVCSEDVTIADIRYPVDHAEAPAQAFQHHHQRPAETTLSETVHLVAADRDAIMRKFEEEVPPTRGAESRTYREFRDWCLTRSVPELDDLSVTIAAVVREVRSTQCSPPLVRSALHAYAGRHADTASWQGIVRLVPTSTPFAELTILYRILEAVSLIGHSHAHGQSGWDWGSKAMFDEVCAKVHRAELRVKPSPDVALRVTRAVMARLENAIPSASRLLDLERETSDAISDLYLFMEQAEFNGALTIQAFAQQSSCDDEAVCPLLKIFDQDFLCSHVAMSIVLLRQLQGRVILRRQDATEKSLYIEEEEEGGELWTDRHAINV